MKRIERLDFNGFESFIRASSIIPSVHTAVEELILNSIDAGATSIEIRVNIPNSNLISNNNKNSGLNFEIASMYDNPHDIYSISGKV